MLQWPIISENPRIQANYEEMRVAGTSHNLAEMFALAEPPASNTDREFLHGHCSGNQFEGNDEIGNDYRRKAEAAGVSTNGKVYLTQLAREPGDPEAWVSGKGDLKKRCEERGWGADGLVKVQAQERTPAPDIAVADNILDREVNEICAGRPDGDDIDKADLREQVRAKRKPHWAK